MSRVETTVTGNATTHVGISTLTGNVLRGIGGVATQISTDNVVGTPTIAELNAAFGTAADVGAGFLAMLDDNGGGTAVFLCCSDGINWHTVSLTKAI